MSLVTKVGQGSDEWKLYNGVTYVKGTVREGDGHLRREVKECLEVLNH